MSTPNLAIQHITATQSQKEVTADEALNKLEMALCDSLVRDVTGGVDVTLTTLEALENRYFDFIGVLSANINVIVPINKKFYVVRNSTTGAFTLKVKTSAGTGIFCGQGSVAWLYCDGTNVIRITPPSLAGGDRYEFPLYLGAGKPDAAATVYLVKMVEAVEFPTNLVGSSATLLTATTGAKTFSVRKNGSQFATIDFAASATEATFTGSLTTFAVGDKLTIVAPTPQDATLAGFACILKGTVQ